MKTINVVILSYKSITWFLDVNCLRKRLGFMSTVRCRHVSILTIYIYDESFIIDRRWSYTVYFPILFVYKKLFEWPKIISVFQISSGLVFSYMFDL